MKNYLESMSCTLPCIECKQHLKNNLKELPPALNSRKELFDWTIDLHNMINTQLQKPKLYTKKEVYNLYNNIYTKKQTNLFLSMAGGL